MGAWNGVSIIRGGNTSSPPVHIWTDASGHYGCGAINPETTSWLQLQWPQTYGTGQLKLTEESIALFKGTPPNCAGLRSVGKQVGEEDGEYSL